MNKKENMRSRADSARDMATRKARTFVWGTSGKSSGKPVGRNLSSRPSLPAWETSGGGKPRPLSLVPHWEKNTREEREKGVTMESPSLSRGRGGREHWMEEGRTTPNYELRRRPPPPLPSFPFPSLPPSLSLLDLSDHKKPTYSHFLFFLIESCKVKRRFLLYSH